MGRGRQKAKQTKVARELKYYSPNTDYDALRKELTSSPGEHRDVVQPPDGDQDDVDEDEYADWSPEPRR